MEPSSTEQSFLVLNKTFQYQLETSRMGRTFYTEQNLSAPCRIF